MVAALRAFFVGSARLSRADPTRIDLATANGLHLAHDVVAGEGDLDGSECLSGLTVDGEARLEEEPGGDLVRRLRRRVPIRVMDGGPLGPRLPKAPSDGRVVAKVPRHARKSEGHGDCYAKRSNRL